MSSRNRIVTPIAFALSLMPFSLFSQNAPPVQSQQVEQWIVEMQAIQTQLAALEQRALQEPALAQEQEALGSALLSAMKEADAAIEAKLERLQQIMIEAHASLGDDARIQALSKTDDPQKPDDSVR